MRALFSKAAFVFAGLVAVPEARSSEQPLSEIDRGRYLTQASNCQGCHTAPDEEPFAGARALETPFGVIYSPNITFDPETGLGRWSRDDFWTAMHEGRSRDGSQLYPAFPYPHFTKMPREEVDAIYGYLSTLPHIRKEKPDNQLPFPFNQRAALHGWNMLFFEAGEFEPESAQYDEWNRGAYLVEGPGHCAGCHTDKNLFGADNEDRHLKGGLLENWFAPNIRGGANGGLEKWSEADIAEFLKHGRNRYSGAYSSMSEVIEYSTQYLEDADLMAIATYLKSLDGEPAAAPRTASDKVITVGAAIYADNCTACHTSSGTGVPGFFADLTDSAKLSAHDPTTVIRVILEGARAVPTKARPSPMTMPAYGWKLNDEQIAALATYLRQSWGNTGDSVSAGEVGDLRHVLRQAPP